MHITLTPEMDRIVDEQISSGRYKTAEEVLEQALGLIEEQDKTRARELADFQQELQERVDSLDRGDFIESDEVFAELREKTRILRQYAA